MAKAKCPKCDATIQQVELEHLSCSGSADATQHQVISILCPSCGTILGTHFLPGSLQEEAVEK